VRVAVILPAFNEARNLPAVLEELREAAPGYDLCVVDDGSTDRTAEVASSLGATVLRCPVNLGIGGAVQTGYLWARERGHDVAVQFDADGQHDPRELAALVAPVRDGQAELVVGSRFLQAKGYRSTWLRRLGIRYLGAFLRLRCGAGVTDPTSGFRAVGRAGIALFAASYPSDYPEPESIALAVRNGLRVAEVAVRMRQRGHGRSSIDALGTLRYLIKVSLALLLLPARPRVSAPFDGGSA
jgi:glycosyltransferase involved in cell wall biosynthesis